MDIFTEAVEKTFAELNGPLIEADFVEVQEDDLVVGELTDEYLKKLYLATVHLNNKLGGLIRLREEKEAAAMNANSTKSGILLLSRPHPGEEETREFFHLLSQEREVKGLFGAVLSQFWFIVLRMFPQIEACDLAAIRAGWKIVKVKGKEKDYSNLWAHLKSYYEWAKPLESVWLLKTSLSAEQVRDAALQHIDPDDKLIVIDVTGKGAAWRKLSQELSTWITNNL